MTDVVENVIRGLECCIKYPNEYGDCMGGNCPYGARIECHKELMQDTLALLKAQEPHVMTLEEVKSLERDTVVWYEHNGVNKQRSRIVEQVYDSGIIFTDGGHWQFNADAYGKKFRLWTSRPDRETREAVKLE